MVKLGHDKLNLLHTSKLALSSVKAYLYISSHFVRIKGDISRIILAFTIKSIKSSIIISLKSLRSSTKYSLSDKKSKVNMSKGTVC